MIDEDWEPGAWAFQDELKHYGILRKSGRYPWGSGGDWGTGDTETAIGRSNAFYGLVNSLKSKGLSETDIATALDISVADLRSTKTMAKEEQIRDQTVRAVKLRDKGTSPKAIAAELGLPLATVRLRLKNSENMKESTLRATAEIFRKNVDKYGIVDVGKGTELHIDTGVKMGIADTKKKAALAVLRDEGYETYNLRIPIVGSRHEMNRLVMVPPGTGFAEAARRKGEIHTIADYTDDGGSTYSGLAKPLAINPKRVMVKYKEDGGHLEDGIIYVRPGVKDLDMGKNIYAQARIQVGDGHYLKGMAVVNRDLPDGVDIVFNSNKSRNDPKIKKEGPLGAMKPLQRTKTGEVDLENPFGSAIKRQITVKDKDGNDKATSAINIVNETGDWDTWRKSLPSQMLAKQPHSLIKSQLSATRQQAQDRVDEINRITNPVVRKRAMEKYADQIDSDAVDLRAASMAGQKTQVILPMPKMRKDEIYAPNFQTGDKVVLIRYPHAGRFEIPEVTVNNNNRTAKALLGNAHDAIGIHPSVAERLSGADFDGDTVVVIPNPRGQIKGSKSMGAQSKTYDEAFKDFDAKEKYGGYEVVGTKVNKKTGKIEEVGNFPLMKNTGKEMGVITNLVTDMQVQGAKPEHVVRAVRHSMVVIDAEKHKLDYKRSESENNIAQLKQLYQTTRLPDGSVKVGGATTLLSQATAGQRVNERKARPFGEGGPIDETGARRYVETGKMLSVYDKKTGEYLSEKTPKTEGYKRLELTDDAYSLVRDRSDPVERLYADHANSMKAMANSARLSAARISTPRKNPKAAVVYRPEVDKLVQDLNTAKRQKPLDRKANDIARDLVIARRADDPTLRVDKDRLRKVERLAQATARDRLGLKQPVIEITDRQWDAIQSGAVSSSRLREILEYADPKRVEELSMPRTNTVMTAAVSSRARAMLSAGATTADVAAALGISASTLRDAAIRGEL